MRRRLPIVFVVVGSLLLAAGLVAGIINREVIDGSRFVDHVDAIRQDPDVSRQVGLALSDRVIEADPDLVVVRPLLESAAQALVAEPAFGIVARASAAQFHNAFTESGPVVIRVADVGAVLTAVLSAYAPQASAKLPANLDATLARVGSQTFAADTIHLTEKVRLLAWLLPLLALLAFAVAVVVTSNRRRAMAAVGWAVFAAGALLACLGFGLWLVTSFADTDTLSGALVVAGWRELQQPVWLTAAGAMVAGAVFGVAVARSGRRSVPEILAAGWAWMTRDSGRHHERLLRAVVWLGIGVGLVVRPLVFVAAIAVALGVAAVVTGANGLLAVAKERVSVPRRRPRFAVDPRWWRAVGITLGVALLVSLLVALFQPVDETIAAGSQSAYSGPCNGHVDLCVRRYDDVAYAATHNSMAAADEPNWFLAEQPTGLVGQLDDGIRVLLIDTWYGQATQRRDIVATASRSRQRATAEAVDRYGQSVVDAALRLRDAASLTPSGPVEPYLCHSMCELGSTKFVPALVQMRAWLDAHPREVVTLFIQDEVTPADTAEAFEQAGLLSYVHTQQTGGSWPTLGEMIASGRRLVVLMENHGGGSTYPWLLQGFDWVQDTPYDYTSPSQFSCRRYRGSAASPLFL
ncbi:MAG TPA: hypothetical protein VH419_09160, partial [Nocardioidaceae bacterium]